MAVRARQQWLPPSRRIQIIVGWKVSNLAPVTLDLVREIALQGVRVEQRAGCARLNERSALPAVDEEFAIGGVDELASGIEFWTLDTRYLVISSDSRFRFG